MSTDLKNSILLWVGAIACAALFWAVSHFGLMDFVPTLPPKVIWSLLGALFVFHLTRFVWGLWRRRRAATR